MRHTLFALLLTFVVSLSWAHGPQKKFDFKENKGQWHPAVQFKAEMADGVLFLEEGALTWSLLHPEDLQALHDVIKLPEEEQANFLLRGHAYKVHFEGANPQAGMTGQEAHDAYYNYFIGNDTTKWASKVKGFNAVRYSQLWEGIGLRVYNSDNFLKYDFILAPGSDPNQVLLRYEGLEGMQIINGELHLTTSIGEVVEQEPYAYQVIGSELVEVPCSYVLEEDMLRFSFPEGYDETRQLVIDPIVIASTLSGTTGVSNYGHSAAYDLAGNIYTGAISFGSGYPTNTGSFQQGFAGGGTDIALSKLNPTGTDLIWASYLGGSSGEYPHSLVTNNQEELYVYGSTNSNNYPVSDNAYDATSNGGADIVVSKLSADGTTLLGSTYIGGSAEDGRNTSGNNYGDTYRGEIFLDGNERPLVASFSSSSNFPTSIGAYQSTHGGQLDAVLFGFNSNLSTLLYSTYLGGSQNDTGFGVRTTADGDIYMGGMTGSSDFPSTAGAYQTTFQGGDGGGWGGVERDGFIARFNPTASTLEACTFYGTEVDDQVFFIDLDNNEDVWVYGQSTGDMPITDGTYTEANGSLFISKFNPELTDVLVGNKVVPSGGFGGFGGVPIAFLVDRCDNVYISTHGATIGLNTTPDAVFTTGGFYLAAYGPDLETLEFATYYTSGHVDGGTSRFDKSGIIYQGVCSGGGFNTNPDAWATDQNGGWDIGVFKMDFQVAGVNASLTASAEALNGCAPHTVDFSNFSVGNIFTWDFGDGSPESNEFEPSHTYTEPGLYTVQLISMDSLSCNIADTAYVDIAVSIPQDFNPDFTYDLDCETLEISTQNTTDAPWLVYTWDMGDGTILEGENVSHFYAEEGEYTITLLAEDLGCIADEEVSQDVQVVGAVLASTDAPSYEGCGELQIDFENTSNGLSYLWDFGDGSPTTTEVNPSHTFTGPGTFTVTLTAYHPQSCNLEDQTELTVTVGEVQDIEAAFQLLQTDCELLTVQGTNQSTGEHLAHEWTMGDGASYDTPDITHNYGSVGNYAVNLTVTDTLCDASDTFELNVNILTEVTAIIGNPNLEGCAPFDAQFVNNSAGTNFFWDFGDGSPIIDAQVASHTYTEGGTYTVTLTVEGSGNCGGSDQTTAEVTVIDPPVLDAFFSMQQQGACEAMTVSFLDESTGENIDLEWDVAGTNYAQSTFEHVFDAPGTYPVTLTINEPVCDASDTFTLNIDVLDGIDLQSPPESYLCYYETSTELSVLAPEAASLEWNTGEEGGSITVSEPGIYTVTATMNNCTDTEGLEVIRISALNLFDNPVVCEGLQTLLEIPYDNGSNYQWCDNGGAVTQIYASEPGEYCYEFNDEYGCLQSGTVLLEHLDTDASVYIPNAFTPNNDGVNDVFKAFGVGWEDFSITVWNRWGEAVFESTDPEAFWDGSFEGGDHYVQNEVYTWRVTYTSSCSSEKVLKTGNVVVLR